MEIELYCEIRLISLYHIMTKHNCRAHLMKLQEREIKTTQCVEIAIVTISSINIIVSRK